MADMADMAGVAGVADLTTKKTISPLLLDQ
jgi:hypothetical protein